LRGNAFTCEPVHNLVHREVIETDGIVFKGNRADDEQHSEFLASTDPWFRPVQARTGPDGCLYIVDMYRFLIEHPRWIPAERLAKIDIRAGAVMGRIYRVVPNEKPLRPVRDLKKLSTTELALALDTPNGTERDRVHLELLTRGDSSAAEGLSKLVQSSRDPAVRAQALATVAGLGSVTPQLVQIALGDEHRGVRQNAVRIAEPLLSHPNRVPDTLRKAILERGADPDLGVRYQLALTLGEWNEPLAGETLATLAKGSEAANPYFRAALLSSGAHHPDAVQLLEPTAVRPLLAPASDAEISRLRADPSAMAKARAALADSYQPSLPTPGSNDHGKEVFGRACALCHKVAELGFDIGPALPALRDKPPDYWVKNILDPNAAIEPRFIASIVELAQGGTSIGIIKNETATSITLAQPGGITGTLLRSEIKHIAPAKSSLMPQDFDKTITPAEMADLLAFLRSEANK
jgi:putative heme-binding domain-containing protein